MKKFYLIFLVVSLLGLHKLEAQNISEKPFVYSDDLQKAAQKGDADAMYKLGICYYVGKANAPTLIKNDIPLERDYKQAFKYLSKAAGKGSALAMLNLGNIYKSGVGAPKGKDLKLALEWYEKAAKKGCADAYANIAKIYETEQAGLITARIVKFKTKDVPNAAWMLWAKSVEYNKLAADNGSAIGAYNLGVSYNLGLIGLAIDYQESIKWFQRAAEMGYKRAANDLAVRYMNGIGIPQNKHAALDLLKMAAMEDEPMSLHNIGVYYYNGIGLPKDPEKALYFFFRAKLMGYNNSKAITECYQAGLYNASSYATEKEWQEALKSKFSTMPMPEIEIPQPQKMLTVTAGDVVNDCGSWTIVDKDGVWITDHRYDLITKDPSTGKLTATLYGLSTTLAEDGCEEKPILEQMLNSLGEDSNSQNVYAKSLQLLQADYDNTLGYRAMAYYNMAVYYHNNNLTAIAEQYLKKSLEVDPNFTAAKEDLTLIQKEAKRKQKAAKREQRAILWQCITTGLSGFSNIMGQVASNQQARSQAQNMKNAANRAHNKEIARANKQKAKNARQKMVRSIGRRAVSRAYTEEVGLINNMKIHPEQYDKQQKEQIQDHMKKIRIQYGLPYNEMEDWGK